jgi:hypothetical protein
MHMSRPIRRSMLVWMCVVLTAAATIRIGLAGEESASESRSSPDQGTATVAQDQAEKDETAAFDGERMEVRGSVVDERQRPVEGVRIRSASPFAGGSTLSDTNGRFRLELVTMEPPHVPHLLAESADRSLMGFFSPQSANTLSATPESDKDGELRITLKPARTVRVTVQSADGVPVEGARVEAIAYVFSFPGSKTDADGHATIRLPPDAEIKWVVALSEEFGFDYYENYRSRRVVTPVPVPDEVSLTLNEPTVIRVRAMGPQGPLEGALVSPWILELPGRLADVNLSASYLARQRTNEQGICTFRWIPAEVVGRVDFVPFLPGFHCPNFPVWDPDQPLEPVVARFFQNGEVSGTVRFEDGSPAMGITILGEGVAAPGRYFLGSTRTDANGTYTMSVYSDHWAIIAVADREWAAASHTRIHLGEGETRYSLDFQLTRGTRIRGRITVGPERQPATGETVRLVEYGEDAVGPTRIPLVRWAEIDSQGNYEFRVGPGKFALRLPNTNWRDDAISIDVTDQEEIVHDHWSPWPHRMRITGRVVDEEGQPVEGATVYGEPVGESGWAGFEAATDENGEFTVDRRADTERYMYYARTSERDLARYKVVPSGKAEVTIQAKPAATLIGYVFDTSGPVADRTVKVAVSVDRFDSRSFNISVQTDAQGRYRIAGLAVGSRCSISVKHDGQIVEPLAVDLDRPGEIKLREVLFLEP